METVDREVIDASLKFIEKAKNENKPFFVWLNTTRMHTSRMYRPNTRRWRASTPATTIFTVPA